MAHYVNFLCPHTSILNVNIYTTTLTVPSCHLMAVESVTLFRKHSGQPKICNFEVTSWTDEEVSWFKILRRNKTIIIIIDNIDYNIIYIIASIALDVKLR